MATSPVGSRTGSPVRSGELSRWPSPSTTVRQTKEEEEPVEKWAAPFAKKFLTEWRGCTTNKKNNTSKKSNRVVLASIRRDVSIGTKVALAMMTRGFVFQNQGFKMLVGFQPTKKAKAKKEVGIKVPKPKTPKSPVDTHMCGATSWNNPNDTWEAHAMAEEGLIPYDRKPCGKKGTIEFKDDNGDTIWMCATHAKSAVGPCARCEKCKDVDEEVTHKVNYLQIGYFTSKGDYVDGECESLKCEGTKKLGKQGIRNRMAAID